MSNKKITEKDKHILTLLTDQYLSPKQIVSRLKISKTAFYKHLNKLKEKGLIQGSAMGGFTKPNLSPMGGCTPVKSMRLHDMEINLKFATQTRYKKRTGFFKGTRYTLYKTTARVWQKDFIIEEPTIELCYKKAEVWLNNLIFHIAQKYRVAIQTYKISHIGEIEEVNSETAIAVKKKGKRWQFRTTEDYKVWLETDASLKRECTETKHPQTSRTDAEHLFEDIHNSWRDGTAFTPKQATDMIGKLAAERLYYAEHQTKHTKVLEEMTKILKEFRDEKESISKRWGW